MIDFDVAKEHAETMQRLKKLADELKSKAIGSGLTAAARPVKVTMAQLAGDDEGLLKKSINQARISARAARRLELFGQNVRLGPGEVAILIGPNKKINGRRRSAVANWQELGTKAHTIRPRARRGILRIGMQGFAKSVKHPGVKATRFMTRSLQQNASEIERGFYNGVNKRIGTLL